MDSFHCTAVNAILVPISWYMAPPYFSFNGLVNECQGNFTALNYSQLKSFGASQNEFALHEGLSQQKQRMDQENNSAQSFQRESSERKSLNRKQGKRQKKGRNIFSNIFRSFLKFLTSKQFFEKEFKRLRKKITKDQFAQTLRQEIKKFQNYVKKEEIFSFLAKKIEEQDKEQYNSIIRASLLFYLENVHITTIQNSKKICPSFRKLHIKELQNFERAVKQLFKEMPKEDQGEAGSN